MNGPAERLWEPTAIGLFENPDEKVDRPTLSDFQVLPKGQFFFNLSSIRLHPSTYCANTIMTSESTNLSSLTSTQILLRSPLRNAFLKIESGNWGRATTNTSNWSRNASTDPSWRKAKSFSVRAFITQMAKSNQKGWAIILPRLKWCFYIRSDESAQNLPLQKKGSLVTLSTSLTTW